MIEWGVLWEAENPHMGELRQPTDTSGYIKEYLNDLSLKRETLFKFANTMRKITQLNET